MNVSTDLMMHVNIMLGEKQAIENLLRALNNKSKFYVPEVCHIEVALSIHSLSYFPVSAMMSILFYLNLSSPSCTHILENLLHITLTSANLKVIHGKGHFKGY